MRIFERNKRKLSRFLLSYFFEGKAFIFFEEVAWMSKRNNPKNNRLWRIR